MKKLIQSTEYCLDQLVAPSFSILSFGLIGIGYNEESIKYVMRKYNTTNIYFIDKILQEESQCIENIFLYKKFAVGIHKTNFKRFYKIEKP